MYPAIDLKDSLLLRKVWTPSGGWWADHPDGAFRAAKAVTVAYTFVALPVPAPENDCTLELMLQPHPLPHLLISHFWLACFPVYSLPLSASKSVFCALFRPSCTATA
uniref:Uncharacterized protein n=1 Tax=Lotharella globosa TaxID=91324 RepID=A0A7S4DZK6_9EUKA